MLLCRGLFGASWASKEGPFCIPGVSLGPPGHPQGVLRSERLEGMYLGGRVGARLRASRSISSYFSHVKNDVLENA